MINSFSQYLVEEERTVYFAFGRMNPPTIGHGKLLDALGMKSGRNPYRLYLSQSNDAKKNPLDYTTKVKHVRKMFPKHARSVMINKKVKTPLHALSALYEEGFRRVVMIAGSDRVQEYDLRLNKYNGVKGQHGFYNFEGGVKIVSAGQRDPDAEGAEGASGTKQRNYASSNDFTGFAQGLPKAMSNAEAKKLFNDVRKGMGLKEAKEFKNHIQLEPVSETREQFIQGDLFEIGEQVIIKKTDEVGTITVLGSNYVIVETADRQTRQWLDAVEKIEEAVWKKGGPDGEVHTQHKGTTWRVRKDYNHNDRHVGEYRIEYKKKNPYGGHDWEWHDTVQGKANAKSRLPESNQPEWGTPESTKKAKSTTPGEIGELSMSLKDLTKSGINKKGFGNKDKLKKDLEKLKKSLNKEDAMDKAKSMIDREKEKDAVKHDRMLDRARLAVARRKNRETDPRGK